MENKKFEENVKKITRLILTNEQKMIREEDLINMCDDSLDFSRVINKIYENLKQVGLELIITNYLEEKYYILTSEGKEDKISPSQYGTLALLGALSKEVDENLKLSDVKEIFSRVWDSDIHFLLENDYIRKVSINDLQMIKIAPLGKALLKNILPDLKLQNLLKVLSS
jgi:chromosome segregation and condensation protein ScpB